MVTISEIKMIEAQMQQACDWVYHEFSKDKVVRTDAIDHRRYELSKMMMRYAELVFTHNKLVKQYEDETMRQKT